jgi:hypothetical protein
MPTKWLDRTQPQTLYIATMLMYFNGAIGLLSLYEGRHSSAFGLHHGFLILESLFVVSQIGGAWGIANEKKWGYIVAVVAAILILAATVFSVTGGGLINLIFEVALVALLLHPQSREYRRIWFR